MRVRQPSPPVAHGVLERVGRFVVGDERRQRPVPRLLEAEDRALAGGEVELRTDAVVVGPKPDRRHEREAQIIRAERRAGLAGERRVLRAAVVEPGPALEHERHLAAHRDHPAQELAAVLRVAVDRHEVLHLAHAVGRQEARDEDVRVREVELLRGVLGVRRRDPVEAALFGVEDRREDARGVESLGAVPVDRPVGADQGNGVEIADDAVLGDGKVAAVSGHGGDDTARAPGHEAGAILARGAFLRRRFAWPHGRTRGRSSAG